MAVNMSVPGRGRCRQAESPGMSINFSIMCILSCLALSRPLVNRCFAAIQRMWSSKINLALRRGTGRVCWELAGLWIVMWRDRLSSLSPVTSTSYKKKKKNIQKKISNSPFGSAIHTNSKINCSTYNFSENTYFTEESLKYSYDSIINHKC